jgi:hypothetical protein
MNVQHPRSQTCCIITRPSNDPIQLAGSAFRSRRTRNRPYRNRNRPRGHSRAGVDTQRADPPERSGACTGNPAAGYASHTLDGARGQGQRAPASPAVAVASTINTIRPPAAPMHCQTPFPSLASRSGVTSIRDRWRIITSSTQVGHNALTAHEYGTRVDWGQHHPGGPASSGMASIDCRAHGGHRAC